MKKVILILIGLTLSSLAFSQSDGYLTGFTDISALIKHDTTTIEHSDVSIKNVHFYTPMLINGKEYVLEYDYKAIQSQIQVDKEGNRNWIGIRHMGGGKEFKYYEKNLYLYRKDIDGLRKVSDMIRTDYYRGHYENGSFFLDTYQAVKSYKSEVRPDGVILIVLNSSVQEYGKPKAIERKDTLELIPASNGMYRPIFK